jgi:hypothetical protein
MNFKKTGLRINDIETVKPHLIKLKPEAIEGLGFKKTNSKSFNEYFIEYLNDEKIFNSFDKNWTDAINQTLPKSIKDSCLWCARKSTNEMDKKCGLFHAEGEINYTIASSQFISIIESNKHIFTDNQIIKKLTIKFFEGFVFQEGRVFFDIDGIVMECLNEGFTKISKIFSENDSLKNLEIINDSLEVLNNQQLQILINGDNEQIHIKPQKKFFKDKRQYYKELIKIEELKERRKQLKIKNEIHQPQQDKEQSINTLPIKDLHNHIFKNNAFEVWEYMFEEFEINTSSRTDVKFIFEEMKKDGLIHKTVNQIDFLDWILCTYDGLIIQKTSNHNRSSNRMKIYSRAIKCYKK